MDSFDFSNYKIRYKSLDFLIFFMYVLMMGKGSTLFSSFDPRYNPLGTFLVFGSIAWLAHNDISDKSRYANIVFALFGGWVALHVFLDKDFEYYIYIDLVIRIIISYFVVRRYTYLIPVYYYKSIVFLAFTSIFLWAINISLGPELLSKAALFANPMGTSYGSMVIYSISQAQETDFMGIMRNCGFAWEPGLYSCTLVLAILFQIVIQGDSYRIYSKESLILFIALITTQSTTGFAAVLALFAIHYIWGYNESMLVKLLSLSVLFVAILYSLSLPFMGEKIMRKADSSSFVTESGQMDWVMTQDQYWTVDRFEGLQLELLNIQYKPLAGCGLSAKDTYIYNNIYDRLVTSNGLTKVVGQLGIPIGILFFIFFYSNSSIIISAYGYRFKYILFIVIILLSVSYNHFYNQIVLAIVFFNQFLPENYNQITDE